MEIPQNGDAYREAVAAYYTEFRRGVRSHDGTVRGEHVFLTERNKKYLIKNPFGSAGTQVKPLNS